MDDVCITFHVIANSSVRKSDKVKRSGAWCLRSSAQEHMLSPDSGHVHVRAGEDTILC